MTSTAITKTPPASSAKSTKDEASLEITTNDDHKECCAFFGTSHHDEHKAEHHEGSPPDMPKPWREGWQRPQRPEVDELSKKGLATAFMLGRFDEFPEHFDDPSLTDEEKLLRRKRAESTILSVMRREASRLGLECPEHYSTAAAERVLVARIRHNRERQRAKRRRSSAVRPVDHEHENENDDFGNIVKSLARMGLEWKPPVEMELD
ncbi:hypothetical protein F5X99DRAFT_379295 [Biscogniauxia marginata]|nr:hypothetical protein F5X99DRAFT_379295 [Biscogniauxia marginata]